jgi:hypothetical protein
MKIDGEKSSKKERLCQTYGMQNAMKWRLWERRNRRTFADELNIMY